MKQPTIVQVVTSGDLAGGQLVSLRVARALVEKGCMVRFVSPSAGAFTRECETVGAVDIIPENSLRDFPRLPALARYLRDVGADLVHTHTPVAASILWRWASKRAGIPFVGHIHIANFYGPPGFKSYSARALDRLSAGWAASHVAVSKDTADDVIAHGYPAEKVKVIYNPIPWEKEAIQLRASHSPLVVGVVGRILHQKGQLDLLEHFARMKKEVPDAELWIIGQATAEDQGYARRVEERADDPDLRGAVKMLGQRTDVRDLMKKMTMLVLPSREEAFPLSLLEAMSIGVPVIATGAGGVAELVENDVTGLLVDSPESDKLGDSMIALARDSALRERLAQAAYASVWNRFNEANTLEPLVGLIMNAARNANRN